MATLTICSFNIEWMNDWFTSGTGPARFLREFTKDGHRNDTHITASRAAAVVRAVDPDILAIQEAPSRPEELDLFIRDDLSDSGSPRYKFFLGDSGAAQKLALLYKPGSVASAQLTPHAEIGTLIDPWLSDVNGDGVLDEYHFTRTPLVVNLALRDQAIQVIVVHTKSNFVNNGKSLWQNPSTRRDYVSAALKNRRRISSEAMRLRRYLDFRLERNAGDRIIVLGDLNDGPGLDYFEEHYLTHNVTDILVGSAFRPEWIFTHAQHDAGAAQRYTAIFDDFVTDEPGKRLLLDHVLLSPGLRSEGTRLRMRTGSGAVRHAEYEAQTENAGRHREDRPSDHRPVTVELEY
ncbi:MAG: endonuclease/exonuclease/phosphatase family protein [Deltaproteobacteria bacterium]|nr:endonuclease/exonuclease/phosphatase family protein [Deltaproteobacteria bacterium]